MKTVKNEHTGEPEYRIPATVVAISNSVAKLKNDKETPYRMGVISIVYPATGETDEVSCRFYVASLEANPDLFKAGSTIEAHIQAEGEYAGRATAHLAGFKVADMSKFGASTKATTKVAEEEEIELE